ncbi:MAG: hypothetical protein ACRDS9_03825 [Pseudonocardiaceae bacterium]
MVTGKPVCLRETVRGIDDAAHRTVRRALNRLVADAEKARGPSSVILLGQVIDEWLRVAEHEESTQETYLGYIERTIKPAWGRCRLPSCRCVLWRPVCRAAALPVEV